MERATRGGILALREQARSAAPSGSCLDPWDDPVTDPLMPAMAWLAARGIDDPSDMAIVGALDEIEHRAHVDALIKGLAAPPKP